MTRKSDKEIEDMIIQLDKRKLQLMDGIRKDMCQYGIFLLEWVLR